MSKALPFRSRQPGTRVGRGLLLMQAAALGCLFAAGPAVSQQSGTITGVVSDVATGQLLESAAVRLDDAPGGVLTNQDGRYVMVGVAAGTHTLTFHILGYDDLTAEVEVVAGETLEYNAELTAGALELQELVVTGVARETPKVKVPFTIEKLDIANIPVPAISAEGFLHGKAPGVKVVRGSGQPGSTGDILLRGATSISGGQAPLVIVDGIITTNAFDDLATLDIESIEIVKGAAGASLYGSRAANGVIQIRTKRGSGFGGRDYSRLVGRTETGQDQLQGSIQLSKNHPFKMNEAGTRLLDLNGEEIENFPELDGQTPAPVDQDPNRNFQDREWPAQLQQYDHVKRIFSHGTYMSNYGAIEGRNGDTNYRSSFEWKKEGGVLPQYNDGFDRRGFRVNLDHKVRNNLNVSLTTAYTQSERQNLGNNPFFDLTFMGPYVDLLRRDTTTRDIRACAEVHPDGCLFRDPDPLSNQLNPLYTFELVDYRNWLHDVKAAASGIWTPLPWLDVEGLFALDRNSSRNTNFTPPGYEVADGRPAAGSLGKSQSHRQSTNGEVTVSANKAFGDLTTRTRLRYLERATHYESFGVSGSDFIAEGVPRLQNLDPESHSGGSYIEDTAERGIFIISALDYRGKYLADGLIRQDESSRFGPENRSAIYYRTALAWRMALEDWWPLPSSLNEFKLHWSRGTAGRRPGFAAQYQTYDVFSGAITPVNAGNRLLQPQRSTEDEFGLNVVLFNKASMTLTYARTTSTEQIINVPLPKSGGFTSQVQNAGTLKSNTWEYNVEVPILDVEDMSWSVRLNLDRSVSRIDSLGRPAFPSSYFFYRDGEVFGSFFGTKWADSCDQLSENAPCEQFQVNDDGLLVWTGDAKYTQGVQGDQFLWGTSSNPDSTDGVTYDWGMPIKTYVWDGLSDSTCTSRREGGEGCAAFAYMGNTTPDLNVSFRTSFRWKDLSVWVLLDGEFGADIYNQTRQWAYREGRSGDQDQGGKPDELKKPVGYYAKLYNINGLSSWFVESGNFVKVRELSVRYALNPDWLDKVFRGRVTGADINLIGRNLYTFTNYSGYDPEVGNAGQNNSAGGSQVIGRIDAYEYPNYRTISASLQLVF